MEPAVIVRVILLFQVCLARDIYGWTLYKWEFKKTLATRELYPASFPLKSIQTKRFNEGSWLMTSKVCNLEF